MAVLKLQGASYAKLGLALGVVLRSALRLVEEIKLAILSFKKCHTSIFEHILCCHM